MATSAIPWALMRPLRVTIAATYKRLPLPVSIVGNCKGPMGDQAEPGSRKRTEDHRIQHSWGAMPGLPRQEGYSKQGHKWPGGRRLLFQALMPQPLSLMLCSSRGCHQPPPSRNHVWQPLVKGGGWAQHTTQAVVRAGGHCSALAQGSRQGARNPFLLQDIGQGKASRALPLSESCHSRWKHHLQPKYGNEVALWTLGPVKRIVGLEPEFNLEFGEQQGG